MAARRREPERLEDYVARRRAQLNGGDTQVNIRLKVKDLDMLRELADVEQRTAADTIRVLIRRAFATWKGA